MNKELENTLTGIIVTWSEDASAGIVRTQDMDVYYFSRAYWFSKDIEPRVNMKVSFEKQNGRARNVRLAE